jgi:hypothetical protein
MPHNRGKKKGKGSIRARDYLQQEEPDNPIPPAPNLRRSLRNRVELEVSDAEVTAMQSGPERHVTDAPAGASSNIGWNSFADQHANDIYVVDNPQRLLNSPVERRPAIESPMRRNFLSPQAGPSRPTMASVIEAPKETDIAVITESGEIQKMDSASAEKYLAERKLKDRMKRAVWIDPVYRDEPIRRNSEAREHTHSRMVSNDDTQYMSYAPSNGTNRSPLSNQGYTSSRKYPTDTENDNSYSDSDENIRAAMKGLNHPIKRESEDSEEFHARIAASYRVKDTPSQRQSIGIDNRDQHKVDKSKFTKEQEREKLAFALRSERKELARKQAELDKQIQLLVKGQISLSPKTTKHRSRTEPPVVAHIAREQPSRDRQKVRAATAPSRARHSSSTEPDTSEYRKWVHSQDILDKWRKADIVEYGQSDIPSRDKRPAFGETKGRDPPKKEPSVPRHSTPRMPTNNPNQGYREPHTPYRNTQRVPPNQPDDDGSSSPSSGSSEPSLSPSIKTTSTSTATQPSRNTRRNSRRPTIREHSQRERTPYVHQQRTSTTLGRRSRSHSYRRASTQIPDLPPYVDDAYELEYEDEVIRRIRATIKDRVGKQIAYDPSTLKNVKPSPPEKYGGEDDIEVFENWLAGLLRWFRVTGLGGRANDQIRVDLCGTNLKSLAADWFHSEVEAWNREILDWTFIDLICALYRRFIHEVTAQNATDKFYSVRYTKQKGALAFYNELNRHADRMVLRPDNYTFKRKFLLGLPHDLVDKLYTARRVTAEHTPLNRLLHEVKAMESSMQAIERHKHARQHQLQQLRTNTPIVVQAPRQERTVRFMTNSPSQRGTPSRRSTPRGSGGRYRSRSNRPDPNRGSGTQGNRPPANKPAGNNQAPKPNQGAGQRYVAPSNDQAKKQNHTASVVCFKCGKIGHYSNECHSDAKPRVYAVDAIPEEGEEAEQLETPVNPDEDQDVEQENAEQHYEGEPMGSQYTSQDEDYPLDVYDDYDGYEEPQSDGDNTELQHFAFRVEEDIAPEITGRYASLGTIDPDEDQDSAMRSSMRRVVGHMNRPLRRPEEVQCLAAYVNINGVEAYTLFDSGSTTDAISPDFARVAELPLYVLEQPMTLKLGCVGSKSKINYGTKAKTIFAKNMTTTYYDVANIDRYDAILGLPYMTANKIVLDIPAQRIRRGNLEVPPIPRGEERTEPRRPKVPRFTKPKPE